MSYLYDEEYKSQFKKLINEFKEFKKNIIIKEKKKSIEGFKVVNSNKYNKKILYLENLEITFKNYYYYFDIKLFFEKFNNYKNIYKFKIKKEIKKYLFYMFLNIYKSQNPNVKMYTTKMLSLNPIEVININNSIYYLYDLKSGKFIFNKTLSKLIFLYNNLFNKLDINNVITEDIIKKYKKLDKNKLDEKLNLLISKKNELHLIKNKNNTLFYDCSNNQILDFDINFNKLEINKDNIEAILKQIIISNNYEIDYYKIGPFDIIEHYYETNYFLNDEKINKKFYNYTYKGKKCYCFQDNNTLDLYDEKEKIKTIEINQEENRNNIFNFINYKDIIEIKNNTNINIKKIDNNYNVKNINSDEIFVNDGFNKQFDIIYENYEFNLIGIILNSEFFILKRNSDLLKGKSINAIYKKLINNRDLLEKENTKCNLIFNF